jgi:creatinine amidohydrolase
MPNAFNTTAELKKHPTKLAILPIGATEQHSDHLPLNTDTLVVEVVAQRVSEKLDAYCLPALPFSISHMHRGSRGTVWLRNSTLTAVIRDLAMSLQHESFSQLAILNGHGGNFVLVPVVQDLNLEFPNFLTMTYDIWEGIPQSGIFEELSGLIHADEFETSSILHLQEGAVKKSEIRDQKTEPDRELLRYVPFHQFSEQTHGGNPSKATAEKGKKGIELMINKVAESIQGTVKKVGKYKKL